ncbi:hypothetical protein INR49_018894 [Caranx melampygus]|nr:hypothetical protein INR49_018894 [Caranx melampygus]
MKPDTCSVRVTEVRRTSQTRVSQHGRSCSSDLLPLSQLASTYTSATMRRPGTSQRQHRRTGSVGTVSDHEVRSIVHSQRSSVTSASGVSVNSASSMDSLDSVLRSNESDGQPSTGQPEGAVKVITPQR